MPVTETVIDMSLCPCCAPYCEHCEVGGGTWLLTIDGSPCTALNRSFTIANQVGEDDNECQGFIVLCDDGSIAEAPPPCVSPAATQYTIGYGLETVTIGPDTFCYLHVDIYNGTVSPGNRVARLWTGNLSCPMDCTSELSLSVDTSYDPFNGCVDGDTTCTMQAI
jgi:hypothetical protein